MIFKSKVLSLHMKYKFAIWTEFIRLYVSLDHIWFARHTLLDLAEYHYTHGGTHLFLDEVHKYKGWQQEIKNIYDSYPDLHVVVTGSSMLRLEESLVGDLSRRHRQYTLEGLSFREYLELEQVAQLPVLSFETVLNDHFMLASQITSKVKVLGHFEKYVEAGYYPFYREEGDGFSDRLQQVIDTIINTEIPSVSNIEYDSVYKAKLLLAVLAESSPYTLNISGLCSRLYSADSGMNMLTKPEKVLFANTNLMYCLTPRDEDGTMRETFLASQLAVAHQLSMPTQGDLVAD